MAETVTHLLAVEYDESQKDLLTTYGVTKKELREVFEYFTSEEAQGKTYTVRMMELINSGKISGGMLLLLATKQIMKTVEMAVVQKQVGEVFRNMLLNSDNPLGSLFGEDDEDSLDS